MLTKEKMIYAPVRKKQELKLPKEEVEQNAKGIFEFLKLIHPYGTTEGKKARSSCVS